MIAALFVIIAIGVCSILGGVVGVFAAWKIERGEVPANPLIQTAGDRSLFRDLTLSFMFLGAMIGLVVSLLIRVIVSWELMLRDFTQADNAIESVSRLVFTSIV